MNGLVVDVAETLYFAQLCLKYTDKGTPLNNAAESVLSALSMWIRFTKIELRPELTERVELVRKEGDALLTKILTGELE